MSRSASAGAPARPSPRPPVLPWPLWCGELELGEPLAAELVIPVTTPEGAPYRAVRVLLRLHGEALGYAGIRLADGTGRVPVAAVLAAAPDDVQDRAAEHLAAEHLAAEHLGTDGRPALAQLPPAGPGCPTLAVAGADAPTVTVAVCTRDRGAALRACLDRLARLSYPRLDVLIVDNAPRDGSTRAVFEDCVGADPRFRYAVEPRPGLSWARNRALAEATGELIAYTDDDVEVDPLWVHGLVRGFGRGRSVGCVTGLVVSATVDGPVEAYFDTRASWGDSCTPRVFSLAADGDDPLFPYSPGIFGTGASFAFRTELLRGLGGFDAALGAGTIAAGGEDLDAFIRVVLSGHELVYEPAALVRHHHRSDLVGLERQMFAHGAGLSALLAKHLLTPGTRRGLLRRLPVGVARLARIPAATVAGAAPDVRDEVSAGGVSAGEISAGEISAGEISAGEITAGEISAGEISAGEISAGSLPVSARSLLAREFAGMAAGPLLYLRSRRDARDVAAVPLTVEPSTAGRVGAPAAAISAAATSAAVPAPRRPERRPDRRPERRAGRPA